MSGNWITKKRKFALVVERDNCTCAYCGETVTFGANLLAGFTPNQVATLDHILPRSQGGDNLSTNLITSCMTCNSARKAKSLIEFVGDMHKVDAIIQHISVTIEYNRKTKQYERLV